MQRAGVTYNNPWLELQDSMFGEIPGGDERLLFPVSIMDFPSPLSLLRIKMMSELLSDWKKKK